ncbi:MAG: ferrous iron transport protein A [Verrucomicrobiae bacterium]|nr:ferrous iron transport protein A [Verrucomicrobiae bacterium]
MRALSELPLGGCGRLAAIDAACGASQRLMAMGFLPGADIKVVGVAPFGDPITVEIRGRRVSLRRADAAAIRVAEAGLA